MDMGGWMDIARSHLKSKKNQNLVEMIKPQKLTHVSCVRVYAPKGQDKCSIYGEVSFQAGGSSYTLFSRGKHSPDDIIHSYLTFSDRYGPSRALPPVSPTNPLHVKMKLFNRKSPDEEEDVLIADIDLDCDWEEDDDVEIGRCFLAHGLHGFDFKVCYSVVFGVRVEVGAVIWERGEQEEDCVLDCEMRAYLCLGSDPPDVDDDPPHEGQIPQTCTLLKTLYANTSVPVACWKGISLERSYVVAPVREDQFLCVAIATMINGDEEETGETNHVYFPLMYFLDEETGYVLASKNMTHIKVVSLINGTEVGVVLLLHRDVLPEEPQTRAKHDIESSVERPCHMDRECEHDDDGGGSSNVALTPSKRPYSLVHEEHGDGGGLN